MKTIITTLFLLITLVSKSQMLAYVTVTSVTDTVIMNDSITIHFTTSYAQTGSNMCKIQLWTPIYLQDCLYTHASNVKAIDSVKVKILPIMGTGNARIYSNATSGYKSFYIKDNDVSVKEYDKSQIVNVKYYDIYGKEKTSIEGLTIRITTYSNGYQKREKIYSI